MGNKAHFDMPKQSSLLLLTFSSSVYNFASIILTMNMITYELVIHVIYQIK